MPCYWAPCVINQQVRPNVAAPLNQPLYPEQKDNQTRPIMNLEDFLNKYSISAEVWEKCSLDWNDLQAIANDHQRNTDQLRNTAEFFARIIQQIPNVHSVRWRVKDPYHLIEKIVRKRKEGSQKYSNINTANYTTIVTDLVGLRVLHLFKEDCFAISEQLRDKWEPTEQPIAYIRSGDQEIFSDQLRNFGLDVKAHPAGYRSIHYVFSSQAVKKPISVEVQIRTIFEEGWSEIDHKIRYPNFSDDPLVSYFLTIFNRFAGSADEMGGFVQGLARTLTEMRNKVSEANTENNKSLQALEATADELEKLKNQDADSKAVISKLKLEIAQLRKNYELEALGESTGKEPKEISHTQTPNTQKPTTELDKIQNSEWYKLLLLLNQMSKPKS